ncbi:hypothetical protein NC652_040127 [Populus alba x Populus x berolinensis]|nr:hypothetical protein NC652_040127 [Populus alba x Populus x berolinensis]
MENTMFLLLQKQLSMPRKDVMGGIFWKLTGLWRLLKSVLCIRNTKKSLGFFIFLCKARNFLS